MKDFARLTVLIALLSIPSSLFANSVQIDFDGLADLDSVTIQFPGLTFSNATVLSAGTSLNEFDFPPFSGSKVVTDDGGSMSISFANPIISFGAYFTYSLPLNLHGFDAGNNLVTTATSVFGSNIAFSGDAGSAPNEFLQVAHAAGISSVHITGDSFGGSFTMDDLTFTTPTSAVPELGSLYLILTGLAGVYFLRKKQLS